MPLTKHSHGGGGGSDETRPLRAPRDKGPVFPRRGAHGFSPPDVLPRQTPGAPGPRPRRAGGGKTLQEAEQDHAQ